MPIYSLELDPEAVAETRATFLWYKKQNESIAKAFLDEVDQGISQIEEGPERWPKYVRGTRRFFYIGSLIQLYIG